MATEETLIAGIEYKVKKLLEVNTFLTKENERLLQENNEAAVRIDELKKIIEENKKEIFKFTLANTLEIDKGVEEGSSKLNSLIDEIDRCIEQLSE